MRFIQWILDFMATSEVSFITVCKGRLHHLQQTLPLMVAAAPAQIIVVDYACPQKAGDWVSRYYPAVRLVRVTDDEGFNVARARNLGALAATSPWLFFVDADVCVSAAWAQWVKTHTQADHFYRQALSLRKAGSGTYGSFLCPHSAFESVQGYDEVFKGWGGEDDDLFVRLSLSGFTQASYPDELVCAIEHDDAQRVAFYGCDRVRSFVISRFYRSAKMQAMAFHRAKGDLPRDQRQQIYDAAEQALLPWLEGKVQELPEIAFRFKAVEGLMSDGHQLVKECTVKLGVQRLSPPPAGSPEAAHPASPPP